MTSERKIIKTGRGVGAGEAVGQRGPRVPDHGCGIGSWGPLEGRSLRMADYVMGTGLTDGATGGHGSQGIPVQFPDSHSIPTSISSEFPRIDVSERALAKDERAPAIQTTSTSKMRRVDFGGCGPPI